MSGVLRPVKGLVAVISGGASGLGRATAERLHRSGAKVAVFDLPVSDGEKVAKQLGENAIFAPVDVTSVEDIKKSYGAVHAKFGRVDAIINCAGIAYAFKLYSKTKREVGPLDRVQKTLNVNIMGTFNMVAYGSAELSKNDPDEMGQRGVIINTSSIAAFEGQVGQSAYSASKGAIHSITLPLARDFADSGIRVCSVAPGLFETPMLSSLPDKVRTFLGELVPNPSRLGNPDEFAALVEHIIQNCYLNGETIRIDGSLRMPP
ncbi:ARD-1 protein [Aphelenchoides avenae]|nr:ARD-1 protein [Aphelenchus avenae]